MKCRLCNSKLFKFADFGRQPFANGFLSEEEFEDEYFFDLQAGVCTECWLCQLISQPPKEFLFPHSYPFLTSTSKKMIEHFKEISSELKGRNPRFVVEIGCNTGEFLETFKDIPHLGVDPSIGATEGAREKGLKVWNEFFYNYTATKIVQTHGRADLIYSANAIRSIPEINSVFKGIRNLLSPDGVFVFEEPYLGDIIGKTAFTQVYDESLFFFSVTSISNVAKKHDLYLYDVEPLTTHEGSMRYYIGRNIPKPKNDTADIFAHDEAFLRLRLEYEEFFERAKKQKNKLGKLLTDLKSKGNTIAGYAATSKGTMLLNWLKTDALSYIVDSTPQKQGLFNPGLHIPVVSRDKFPSPDYFLNLAPNHKEEIRAKETFKGKWIEYSPTITIEGAVE